MKTVKIPDSVRAEIKRQAGESPQVILPEDRSDFMVGVEDLAHTTDAEGHWNNLVDANQEQHRLQRHSSGHINRTTRTPYFLSAAQVAARWNTSLRTVRRMIQDGRLPSIAIGTLRRVRESDVEKVESNGTVAA